METVNITNKCQNYPEALHNTPIIKRFFKYDIDSFSIKRANSSKKSTEKTSRLGEHAKKLYSLYKDKASREERVFFNHRYMFFITGRGQRQNNRIIRELEDVLDVTYHKSVTYKGVKKLNTYEISKKKCLVKTKDKTPFHQTFMSGEMGTTTYISKKDNIENIRSMKSNFLDKDVRKEIAEKSVVSLKIKPTANLRKKRTVAEIKEQKIINASKTYRFKQKKLADFYPLSQEACHELQKLSGREFNLNAMNQILLKISKSLDHTFYNHANFMKYMTKIYANEMRDAVKVNNETFVIKANMTEEDSKRINKMKKIENYLSSVENSREVSQKIHLKKKLVSVLKPSSAYEVLKNFKSIAIEGSRAVIELFKCVILTEHEIKVILSQVKATHEYVNENNEYMVIKALEFKVSSSVAGNITSQMRNNNKQIMATVKEGIWGDIRNKIIETYGSEGEIADTYWISNLSAEVDEENKHIKLKASRDFFRKHIEEKYQYMIQMAANIFGFKITILR